LEYGQTALNKHELSSGENVLVALGVFPLKITAAAPVVGATSTITVDEFGFDASYQGVWIPSASSSVKINGSVFEADASGTVDFVATSSDPVTITVTKTGFITTSSVVTPTSPAITSHNRVSPPSSGGGGGGSTPQRYATYRVLLHSLFRNKQPMGRSAEYGIATGLHSRSRVALLHRP